MESIVNELQCPICLEFLHYPVVLPCSHVLCRNPCAERLFHQNFIRCPVCRDSAFVNGGLNSLPRVITLDNIIDRYRNPESSAVQIAGEFCGVDDVACQLCEAAPFKAKKFCIDCNAAYCTSCLGLSHPNREPFIRHVLVSPSKEAQRPLALAEPTCARHNVKVALYCEPCDELCCLLCAGSRGLHSNHSVLSLSQATDKYKRVLESDLGQLQRCHSRLSGNLQDEQRSLQAFRESCAGRRTQIVEQCEGLVSEIAAKRDLFLSDLEYEERSKSQTLLQQLEEQDDHCSTLQHLIVYTQESMHEANACTFVQLAKCIHDRIERSITDAKSGTRSSPSATELLHKVLDLRKIRATIRDITYLTVPSKPSIDVEKCTRSVHSVVLVLCPPTQHNDVIDEYRVYYATPAQARAGNQSTMLFKTPGEQRNLGRGPITHNAVCLIHDDLNSATPYTFSVRAYNAAGESAASDVIECSTLVEARSKLKVPVIIESMCRTYSCAIQIHSPSPCDVTTTIPANEVAFYLLYREADGANKIWKSIALCGRVDHRVFGLESNVAYDFVVMACENAHAQGECQVSNMVSLRTEAAAV